MISVIIPLYNKSKYIKRAIDSILNQSFQDFEIVIVDDGSTDNSLEIAQNLSKLNDKISVYAQENQGVSAARNTGISRASHEFIAFLDADDYYHFRFLETMHLIFSKFRKIEILSTAITHNILENDIKYFNFIEIDKNDFFKLLLRYHPLLTSSSTVIKKDLLTKNNLFFDENLKFGEDTDFWNRCIKKSSGMIYVPTKLVCYDINDSNTSITNNSLKSIYHTYFYKILNTKELDFLQSEKRFSTFYVYRYFITYYNSIITQNLLEQIFSKINQLEYKVPFIHFLLKYCMKGRNKDYVLKCITYYRLIFSKSIKSLSFQKHVY